MARTRDQIAGLAAAMFTKVPPMNLLLTARG